MYYQNKRLCSKINICAKYFLLSSYRHINVLAYVLIWFYLLLQLLIIIMISLNILAMQSCLNHLSSDKQKSVKYFSKNTYSLTKSAKSIEMHYASAHIDIYIYTHTHTRPQTHIHICTHKNIPICTYTRIPRHTHSLTCAACWQGRECQHFPLFRDHQVGHFDCLIVNMRETRVSR